MKKKVNIVYLCIHKKFFEYARNGILNKKKATSLLTKNYHIPKSYVPVVFKELEFLKLVDTKTKGEIKILDCNINLENTSKIYKQVGLF